MYQHFLNKENKIIQTMEYACEQKQITHNALVDECKCMFEERH